MATSRAARTLVGQSSLVGRSSKTRKAKLLVCHPGVVNNNASEWAVRVWIHKQPVMADISEVAVGYVSAELA